MRRFLVWIAIQILRLAIFNRPDWEPRSVIVCEVVDLLRTRPGDFWKLVDGEKMADVNESFDVAASDSSAEGI